MPGEPIGKLYYRQGIQGIEELLFDPATYIPGKNLTVESFVPSYDGKKIAVAYSESGAEVATIKIINVDTRQLLKDEIYPVVDFSYGWGFDNNSLFYTRIKSADNTDPQARLNPKIMLHQVGNDVAQDIDLFSNASYPGLQIAPKVYPYIQLDEENKTYIFAGESSAESEYKMCYASISQLITGKVQWAPFCTPSDGLVKGMEFRSGKVYAISHQGAPNFKLVATNLLKPDWKNPETIAAERKDQTLEAITRCKNFLLLTYSDGINNLLYKYSFDTQLTSRVKLPSSATVNTICLDHNTDECIVTITSWNRPVTEYDFDAASGSFKPGSFNKPLVYPDYYKNLEVKEVKVKGHDGALIPLTIVYKKGTKLDGNNVCIMFGYGAYGISISPEFKVVEKGGVIGAIAHVRGGGEKGEAWYKGGYKSTKPNTWKDFNSCAEYLIARGYTRPSKLAGSGTSAGGIMISRAITERPDLYAAAICNRVKYRGIFTHYFIRGITQQLFGIYTIQH